MAEHRVGWTFDGERERTEIVLDDEGLRVFEEFKATLFVGEGKETRWRIDGDERVAVRHELEIVLRAYLDGVAVLVPRAEDELPPTDALKLFEDVENQNPALKVPDAVKAYFAAGQTVLSDDLPQSEPTPQATLLPPEGTTPLPYPPKSDDKALPSPDENQLGKFHGPAANAPETERRAAIMVTPKTGTQRRKVLDYIAGTAAGATDEEIAEALGMLANTERPRRVELEEQGWIRDSGRRRPTAGSGTLAAIWVITDEGRRLWRPGEAA